jgi:hypothetical protein
MRDSVDTITGGRPAQFLSGAILPLVVTVVAGATKFVQPGDDRFVALVGGTAALSVVLVVYVWQTRQMSYSNALRRPSVTAGLVGAYLLVGAGFAALGISLGWGSVFVPRSAVEWATFSFFAALHAASLGKSVHDVAVAERETADLTEAFGSFVEAVADVRETPANSPYLRQVRLEAVDDAAAVLAAALEPGRFPDEVSLREAFGEWHRDYAEAAGSVNLRLALLGVDDGGSPVSGGSDKSQNDVLSSVIADLSAVTGR